MFIIHVDLDSMTITSIESSTLLPITTVHYLTSELFILWSGDFYSLLFFFLFLFISYFNIVTCTSVNSENRKISRKVHHGN